MNFLQMISRNFQRFAYTLVLVSTFAIAVFGQNIPPQQQGKMYGDPGFRGEPINLKVVNADIRDILNYITEQYGINFVIDKSVQAVPVTVNVTDVPWNIALDSILQSQELGIQVNGSILRIAEQKVLATEGEIARRAQESQLDRSPLYTEFVRLNYARAAGSLGDAAGSTGGFSGGVVESGLGSGATSPTGGGGDAGILGIVKRRLSRRGAVEVDSRSNTLIITDVRENIDAIRQLVLLLDQPEPQVEIETRIVIAQRNFLKDIGVQIGFNANPFTRNNGGAVGGQVGRPSDSVPTGTFFLTTGVFGTAQITAALNLSESKGQSKTIASPRVTALNNRSAQIESGSQIPVTTIQRGEGGGDGIPVFTTTFVNVPLRLSVTPQISDAGVVILRIVAENNNVNPNLASGLGGTPGIDTQRMQTEVLVPDGGTTVIGGVVVDLESKAQSRVPGLSSIPVLGNLFKNRTTQRNTNEILFFITPRIYRPDFSGNPTSGTITDKTRTTTIIQPVPLGNPPSNSDPTPQDNRQNLVPVTPVVPGEAIPNAPGNTTKP